MEGGSGISGGVDCERWKIKSSSWDDAKKKIQYTLSTYGEQVELVENIIRREVMWWWCELSRGEWEEVSNEGR